MNKINVCGMGPGHPDYILPLVHRLVGDADMLIGGLRHLELFKTFTGIKVPITKDIQGIVETIKNEYADKKITILVSGDPGLYSFTQTLMNYFPSNILEVYPGISAVQYLFAKGIIPWHESYITSLHGRELLKLEEIVGAHEKVALFTDAINHPNAIVKRLQNASIKHKRILVGENLSYDDECITKVVLEEWIDKSFSPLNVMVIYDE
ncbi:precorrin-6y C5,15-methyltransferase (decarboxylating) subunit CbiE [Vallitalea okinawensis]|uniref:precorrin-6y C5,15-methyltransferase (decarboxylating) subunit CbiE n=1 Tax=Vallitalea okinawensis TaxID=2078660 RepID=UPI000CFC99F7|nr:precorrin-6y C5,15-methyltransferase (decarboxylating) subunit CbiE [Vallitalea okinawensis]